MSKNSAPGPDGIPFSAYRTLAIFATPILHSALLALSSGHPPPPGFNHATLHVFPKDESLLATRVRPISVPNTDNRLISATIKTSIMPHVDRFVLPNQTGYINGRKIDTNITRFNTIFYEALYKKEECHILFIDFNKAFDSISHSFLLKTLKHIGMGQWFVNTVKGLLTDLQVTTALSLIHI